MVLFATNEYSVKYNLENVLVRLWGQNIEKKQIKIDKSLIKSKLYYKQIELEKEKISKGYVHARPFLNLLCEKEIKDMDELKEIYIRKNLSVYDLATQFVVNRKIKGNQKMNKERLIFDVMISQFENKMEYEYPICYKSIYQEIESLNMYNVSLEEITFVIDDILAFDGIIYGFITDEDSKTIRKINKKLNSHEH